MSGGVECPQLGLRSKEAVVYRLTVKRFEYAISISRDHAVITRKALSNWHILGNNTARFKYQFVRHRQQRKPQLELLSILDKNNLPWKPRQKRVFGKASVKMWQVKRFHPDAITTFKIISIAESLRKNGQAGDPPVRVVCGDAGDAIRAIDSNSIDAVITDMPYAEIEREYGRLSEDEWHHLVDRLMPEIRRVLKPYGSAVFILQPNSKTVGSMRPWLWQFIARYAVEWNLIQDCYWWNIKTPPTIHSNREHGLMRPSVKYMLWFGDPKCYRNQNEILWTASNRTRAVDLGTRAVGSGDRISTKDRGGVIPYNLLPLPGGIIGDGGSYGHGAATPLAVAEWWVKYICPPDGLILDCFGGSGTMGVAAVKNGRNAILLERDRAYCDMAEKRLNELA